MKVVILAGGLGTRLSEYTDVIPKPMVPVGDRPLLWHIMSRYAMFGHTDFIVALGYRADVIKRYFLNYREVNSDFTIDLQNGNVRIHNDEKNSWTVTLVDTGQETMTGGRLLRLRHLLESESFLLTYGDGVADVNIENLIKFHQKDPKLVTVTAVHPGARFGELLLENGNVLSFAEKPQIGQGWINGGFFVMEPGVFDFLADDTTILERKPLEDIAQLGMMNAFQHEGFWHCVDTKRDLEVLEQLWQSEQRIWLK